MATKIISCALLNHLAESVVGIIFPNEPGNCIICVHFSHGLEHFPIFSFLAFIQPALSCGCVAEEFFRQFIAVTRQYWTSFMESIHCQDEIFMALTKTHIMMQLVAEEHIAGP